MIIQNMRMAGGSIRQHKLRAFLTVLGIIIGVSSVVSVFAIGAGLKNSISDQVASFGPNLLQITPGQSFSSDEEGENSGFNFAASIGASTLTEKDVEVIRGTENVKLAAPMSLISGVPSAGDKQAESAFTAATTEDMYQILSQAQKLAQGRFLRDGAANEAVLGDKVAEKLFGTTEAEGKSFEFRNQRFNVVGVLAAPENQGFSFGFSYGDIAYIPLQTAKKLAGGVISIMEIDVHIADVGQTDETKNALRERLLGAHGGEEDFTVSTPDEQLAVFDQIMTAVTGFIAAIAGISLLVGGIGIMNIMLVSVTERTREIGIRKAIGATRGHILVQFLIEAIILSLLGGLLGVALAYGQGQLVKQVLDITPQFTGGALGLAVGVSTAVGVIFGITPAIKAARKNPVEALRYE